MSDNILAQTKEAYQSKAAPDMALYQSRVPIDKSLLELASEGYARSAREKEVKKASAKSTLWHVISLINEGRLPESLRAIADSPPATEELKYLSRDVQILATDLEQLDKAIGGMGNIEAKVKEQDWQKHDWIKEAIRQGVTDRSKKLGDLEYPHQLEATQKSLAKATTFIDQTIGGVKNYQNNNPDAIKKATERLTTLRKELQVPMPYSEAKSGLPAHKKPVLAWLEDLKVKGSLEDRLLAQKALAEAGIDAKGILTEVEREGMSLADKAIAELRDKEAGISSPESPNKGTQSSAEG